MAMSVEAAGVAVPERLSLALATAAVAPAEQVLARVDSSPDGLSSAEAKRRLRFLPITALRAALG